MRLLLTGGRSDIGLALAKRLGKDNDAEIIVTSRKPIDEALRVEHAGFRYLSGIELTDEGSLQQLRDQVKRAFSAPFSIVHSVGDFWDHRPFEICNIEVARSFIASHYLSLHGALHAVLPVMQSCGGGNIVAFSCNSVSYNYPEMAPFTSAKAAVESLIRCVANEYSEFGICANAIALPTIATDKVASRKLPDHQKDYIAPEELADFIVDHLNLASPFLNGSTLKMFKYSKSFYNEAYFTRNPSRRVMGGS